MKKIECLSIQSLGSRVRYLTWGHPTWTFARTGKILPTILCFHEEKPIPREEILDPDLAYDVIIQRLETPNLQSRFIGPRRWDMTAIVFRATWEFWRIAGSIISLSVGWRG